MSDQPGLRNDEELLAAVDDMLEILEPPPDHVLEAVAEASFRLRRIEAELAELVTDSLDAPLAGLRDTGSQRTVVFRAGGTSVELAFQPDGYLVGQVLPPQEAAVRIESPRRTVDAEVDELGRFGLAIDERRVRATVSPAQGIAFTTPWVFR